MMRSTIRSLASREYNLHKMLRKYSYFRIKLLQRMNDRLLDMFIPYHELFHPEEEKEWLELVTKLREFKAKVAANGFKLHDNPKYKDYDVKKEEAKWTDYSSSVEDAIPF